MNAKVLFNAGYIEYDVPKVEPYANRYFQKKISDKKGIKYYIDVYEYELYDRNNYEFLIRTQKNNYWIKIHMYAIENMSLDEIENEFESIWEKTYFNYYK